MILIASSYKIQNPQALLNQGIVMCENTPMSTNDKCPVTECHLEDVTGYGMVTLCRPTGETNNRDQQREVNQQKINDVEQSYPVVGSVFCIVGLVIIARRKLLPIVELLIIAYRNLFSKSPRFGK